MSLLSNKSLHFHQSIQWVRTAWRARHTPSKVLTWPSHDCNRTEPGQQPCNVAMDTALSELSDPCASQKPKLCVVLADASVHFDIVRGDFQSASDRQLQSIATACITEVLGEAATNQVVRWQLQPDSQHLLISSIDQEAVSMVAQAVSLHGLQVHSLQPNFCRQWNQYAKSIPASRLIFATLTEGYAIVAYAHQGTIMALSCGLCFNSQGGPDEDEYASQAVDVRVDRLLASLGQVPSDVSTFVLVTSAQQSTVNASRWTTFKPSEEPV